VRTYTPVGFVVASLSNRPPTDFNCKALLGVDSIDSMDYFADTNFSNFDLFDSYQIPVYSHESPGALSPPSLPPSPIRYTLIDLRNPFLSLTPGVVLQAIFLIWALQMRPPHTPTSLPRGHLSPPSLTLPKKSSPQRPTSKGSNITLSLANGFAPSAKETLSVPTRRVGM
jgi:hypothetical protein